jgi:hypothetical protein
MRTIFGQPTRECTTNSFYPDKINLYDFKYEIESSIVPFIKNMEDIGITKERYIEEWSELFLSWMEIEEER